MTQGSRRAAPGSSQSEAATGGGRRHYAVLVPVFRIGTQSNCIQPLAASPLSLFYDLPSVAGRSRTNDSWAA